ncbi:MAG: hypothetical protein WBA74_11485 [Cyclobacteriaceae bacterium]
MKKLIFIGAAFLCLFYDGNAQTGLFNEALLFSRTSFLGSTRMQSLGGAHVSLGGDISSAYANPAGLGFYNRSEVTFTPVLKFQNTDSRFFQDGFSRADNFSGGESSSYRGNIGLFNFGLVFNKPSETEGKFKGWNLAFSIDRTNDFNEEIAYRGENNISSLTFAFADNAFNIPDGDLRGLEGAAFETFILNPDLDGNGNLIYDPITLFDTATVDGQLREFYSFPIQEEVIRRSGSQNQWSFAAGGNYDDRIFFGGGIGITSIGYEQDKVFRESEFYVLGEPGVIEEGFDGRLDAITLREDLRIDGIGINATLGMIFRPVNFLTFGISYITPTIYTISEESTFTLTNVLNTDVLTLGGDFIDAGSYEILGDIITSNYSLRVPGKLNLGSSVIIGKYGFITGSVEITDYSRAELNSPDFFTDADNDAIQSLYTSVTNVRVGGELRLDNFRLRAGYAVLNNPFEAGTEATTTQSISYGAGYKTREWYADLGVVSSSSDRVYSPYLLFDNSQPIIESEVRDIRVVMTVGFTF